ncbi:MAG TPA: glycosyltransferase family 4 protein [Flavobacterium sp.]|jgi:glycosyltransferase involved in cell wall biosynthesis
MEGSLKILMTADSIGGVWTYCIDLCRALLPYDVEVHLAVMGKYPDSHQRKQAEQLPNVTLHQSTFKLEWMHEPWEDVDLAQDWLVSIYEDIKPDMMHFNNYGQVNYDWDCPVITVFHSCVLTWWQAVKNENAPAAWERYGALVASALANSDAVVFPTEAIKLQAECFYGKIENTSIINNARNINIPSGIPKEPFIFCAGRIWDEAKNIHMLSRIAGRLPWPLFIAGDNGDATETYQNIVLLGTLNPDEIRQWMAKASIYINPAKYEPFGLSVLEAAKAGCALALSGIDTLLEIWNDSAVYFDPHKEDEALQALSRLVSDKNLRQRLSLKAKERAVRYDTKLMANQYMSLYKKAAKYKAISQTL